MSKSQKLLIQINDESRSSLFAFTIAVKMQNVAATFHSPAMEEKV